MDPIVAAVVAALGVMCNASLGEAAKKATVDAYEGLKGLVKRKFAKDHPAAVAIEQIEARRAAPDAVEDLAPKIAQYRLGEDPEILEAAHRLQRETTLVLVAPVIKQRETHYHGDVFGPTGDNSTATYTFGELPGSKKVS